MNRFLLGVIACLVVALFVREGCNGAVIKRLQKGQKLEQEVAKKDTIWQRVTDTVTAYVPKPYAVTKGVGVAKQAQTLEHCSDLIHYRDTVTFQYGSVVLNDQVQNNQIISRQHTWNMNVPVVTVPAKKRNEFYFGVGAAYRLDTALAFGPSLMLKTKRDKVYEANLMLDSRGKLMVGAGVKFKISFRK
jgi:hypothetical protein